MEVIGGYRMDEIQIGRLVVMSQRKWRKFQKQYRHFGQLLNEMIVKDMDNGDYLVEMSRIETVQNNYEKRLRND